jgi:hypothetical protein
MFVFWGVRGQRIYVDPQSKLVMVNTAVHKQSVDLAAIRRMDALWSSLVRQLGGSDTPAGRRLDTMSAKAVSPLLGITTFV